MQPPSFQLSVHLTHDCSWTANDNPVYGPGSTIQGFVRVERAVNDSTELVDIDQLRILFYASEALGGTKSDPRRPTFVREQFFGSQHILWRRKENDEQNMHDFEDGVQDFHFAVEMPMVQFPPSMLLPGIYMTKFRLVASMLRKDHTAIATSEETPVEYMPLIESRGCKDEGTATCKPQANKWTHHPEQQQQQQQQGFTMARSIQHNNSAMSTLVARLESLNYVVGDEIHVDLTTGNNSSYDAVCRLMLTQNLLTHDGRHMNVVVAESESRSLQLPRDLLPTVSYSKLMSVQYRLKVVVSPIPGPSSESSSSVLRLPRFLCSTPSVTFNDIPIHIGNLGYGLRAPADLKPYSIFKNVLSKEPCDDNLAPLPVPRFTAADEIKDALPVYEGYHLPNYEKEQQIISGSPF